MKTHNEILIESHYLPSIAFFALAQYYGNLTLEAKENFRKGSYRNRCEIMSSNGKMALSVPLEKGKNENMPITDVKISYDSPWQHQHWMSLQSAYGKSPFWEHYSPYFFPVFHKKYEYLFDLNQNLILIILKLLKSDIQINCSTHWKKNIDESGIFDGRNLITPKQPMLFNQTYQQVFSNKYEFNSNLSIFDLLMCEGQYAKLYLTNIASEFLTTLNENHQGQ
ncbi:MAG: WbqC family protein [Saprospiraceae bacterium]|nr:WbqC family protein [Saprospiraceae bacterium]